MRNSLLALTLALTLGLAACSGTTSAVPSLAEVKTQLQTAITGYGVAKGIAEVAVIADPTLAPEVAKITAVLDPLVATGQAALAASTSDPASLVALVAQINADIVQIETLTASKIKAVPSAA